LSTQVNTQINNKYKFTRVKQSYCNNNILNLQQFNLKKRLKIKIAQNLSLIKAKINKEVIRTNKNKTKLIIYSDFLNKIIKNNYNCKEENCKACLAALDLLRNSISSIYSCVLDKDSRKLDLSKTSIELVNIVCAQLLFDSKRESIL